ncbi:adenine phosphoribosyltransferase, partial [Aduncisulcus paluster]
VMIVDDLLATGGTACAARKLIEKAGGEVVGALFLVELSDLKGREREGLKDIPCHSILKY